MPDCWSCGVRNPGEDRCRRCGVKLAVVPANEKTTLEELEDATAAYFTGRYPLGSCADREQAERRMEEAANRALARTASEDG